MTRRWSRQMHRRWRIALAALVLVPAFGSVGVTPSGAQHPPLSPRHDPEEWLTISDFRHVTAAAAGEDAVFVGTAGGVLVLSAFGDRWAGTITAGDGLPSPVVTALAYEPAGGKLWIGTPLGLALYDPFRDVVEQDPLRLGAMPVREIRMGTPEGAAGEASSTSVELPSGHPQAYVLVADQWYRSDSFLLRAEAVRASQVPAAGAKVELDAVPFLASGSVRGERSGRPESFRVTAATRSIHDRLVLGTWGGGAYVYDGVRLVPEPRTFGLAGGGGGALGWDGRRLWFGNAVSAREREARSAAAVVAGAGASALQVEDARAIASATPDLADWRHAYPGLEPGLPSDRVRDVSSAGGRTFFATEAGLAIFDAESERWLRAPYLPELQAEVLAVEAAPNGLWLGSREGLVALRAGEDADPVRRGDAEAASDSSSIAADSLRVVGRWLGDRTVLSLAGDDRELYAGTDLGLFRLAPGAAGGDEWTLSPVRTVGREVRDVELLEHEVVVATDRGVEVLSRAGGEPLLFLVGEGRLDDAPNAVAADDANLWIATRSGVARWDRARGLWIEYGLTEGLPALPVFDVLLQDERTVWFATPGGATRFGFGEGRPPSVTGRGGRG